MLWTNSPIHTSRRLDNFFLNYFFNQMDRFSMANGGENNLGKIEIPILANWPDCRDMRIAQWVLNNSTDFFRFITRIEHEKLLDKIFQEVTISNNGRHNNSNVVTPLTTNRSELFSFNHIISIIHADKLMRTGYHFPPVDNYFDERDRAILNCKIKLRPISPQAMELWNKPTAGPPVNRNFKETLELLGPQFSSPALDFPKNARKWIFKLEICISLSERCLITHYSNDSIFMRSNRVGSCITHRIPFLSFLHHLKNSFFLADGDLFSTVDLQQHVSACDEIRRKVSNYNRRMCENAMGWIASSHNSDTRNSFNMNNNSIIQIIQNPQSFENNLTNLFDRFPISLKRHQKNAIGSLLKQEENVLEDMFYVKLNNNYKYSPITNSFREARAPSSGERKCRGGFLCDDTGLGKTLTILTLCAITAKKGPSLVIVPVSVLHHWKREVSALHNLNLSSVDYYESEMTDWTHQPSLFHFYVYYGQSRIRNPERLHSDNSVIITTYATLVRDFSKFCTCKRNGENHERILRSSPLHSMNFQRLILDESHKIPPSSKASIVQIRTDTTWCVSATPLGSGRLCPNLHTQLDILLNCTAPSAHPVLDPPSAHPGLGNTLVDINPKAWRNHIMAIDHEMHPIMNNPTVIDRLDIAFGPSILLHLLTKLVVRNTVEHANSLQGQVLVPSVNYVNITTTLNTQQRTEYYTILSSVKGEINRYQRNGATCLRRFNILRQWLSLSGCNISTEEATGSIPGMSMIDRPPVLSQEAREALRITPDDTCSVCLDTFQQPCLLPCNHFLCYSCVLSIRNHSRRERDRRCPLCRSNYADQELRLYEEEVEEVASATPSDEIPQKVLELIEYLVATDTQKCVIFSEFKATHAVVQKWFGRCENPTIQNITVMILNGSLSAAARNKMMLKFEETPNCILILSVRACVAGINLQSSNTVVFMEPMISKSDEHQAIGRVRRIGQHSPTVNVVKIVYEATIEQKISEVSDGWRPNVHNMLTMLG